MLLSLSAREGDAKEAVSMLREMEAGADKPGPREYHSARSRPRSILSI